MSRIYSPRRSRSPTSSQERELQFPGYGDRIGAGVEYGPKFWKGGEVVNDPTVVNHALTKIKPKKFFYSPIGDGVVAADGVEWKRLPNDPTPKVTIIQTQSVERGAPGKGGVNVIEKTWSTPLPGEPGSNYYRSESILGGESGRTSRATAASPFGSLADPLGMSTTSIGGPPAATTSGYGTGSRPGTAEPFSAPPSNYNTLTSRPYDTLGSTRSEPVGPRRPLGTEPYVPRKPDSSVFNGLSDLVPPPAPPRPIQVERPIDLGPRPPPIIENRNPELAAGQIKSSASLYEPGYRYEIKRWQEITNPKELIHQYATHTPISTIPGYQNLPDGGVTTRMVKQEYSMKKEEMFAPYPPYHAGHEITHPNKFVRQLRDENLTATQRQANQHKDPIVHGDIFQDRKIQEIRQRTTRTISPNPEIDGLTDQLMRGLQTGHHVPPKL